MSALQLWLQNHNRRLTQDAIDEALMEYITHVETQRDALMKQRDELMAALVICRGFLGNATNFDAYGSEKELAEFLQRVRREEDAAVAQADAAIASVKEKA